MSVTSAHDLSTKIQNFLQEDWKTIVPFDSMRLPPFPATIFTDNFRGFIENVAESTQTPIDAAGMTLLSILSAASSKKVTIKPYKNGDWAERTNLYTLTAMRSGERKSAVYNLLTAPLIQYQITAQQNYREANPHLTEDQLKLPTYLVDDVTPEKLVGLLKENNEKMAMLSSEGGLFDNLNGRYSSTPSLDIFLKGFTGDYMTVHRMSRASETLYEPILTIGLFAQPGLLQSMPARLSKRGFLGRFLYSSPHSIGIRKVSPTPIKTELMKFYSERIELLMNFDPDVPITFIFDEEAEHEWLKFAEEHEHRLNGTYEFAEDSIRSWAERLPGHLLKIIALMHLAEYLEATNDLNELPNQISIETTKRVLESKEYFIEHAKATFGIMSSNECLENAKYLLERILTFREPVIKKQDLWRKTKNKFTTAINLNNAISILEDHGYVRTIEKPSRSGLGRRGMIIEIHPDMIQRSTDTKVTDVKVPLPNLL